MKLVKFVKLVKFAPIHCAAISVFLFAALSAQATMFTGGGEVRADGSYVWNDKANWGGNTPPRYSNGVAEFPKEVTLSMYIATDYFPSFTQCGTVVIPSSSTITLTSDDPAVAGMQINQLWGLAGALILDGKVKVKLNSTKLTGLNVTAQNGATLETFANAVISGVNFTIESGATYVANTIGQLMGGSSITVSGSTMTGSLSSNAAHDGSIVITGGSTATFGNFKPSATLPVEVSDNSTLTVTGPFYVDGYGADITISGKSTFTAASYTKLGKGAKVVIDDSTLEVTTQAMQQMVGSTADTVDSITFKGVNPVLRVANNISLNGSAPNGLVLNFEVPTGGFVQAPIQNASGSAVFSNNKVGLVHVNVLKSSPAISSGYKTVAQLVESAAGIKSYNGFDFAGKDSAVGADAYLLSLGGGTVPATSDATATEMWVTVGEGPIYEPPVTESTGVSTFSAVAVDGATITLSSTITQLSTEGETQVRWMHGTAPDALTCYKTEKVTEKGMIVQDYVEPVLGQTYYVQVLLDTLDANGAIVHTESSLVRSARTADDATYTWRDVDGDWTGDWNDPRHWTADKDGDRVGYPATADTSAVFPGGHAIVVRMDAPHTVTALNLSAADIDVTFVNQPNVTKAENAITMAGTDKTPNFSGNNGRIVFRGVSVKNVCAHFSIGAGKTVRFENADLSSKLAFSAGGGGSWLEVTDGSVVSFGTSPYDIYSGGVMISNATLSASFWATSAGRIRFAGKTPLLTVGPSGICPKGDNSRVRLEFCIPEGGYDASVIQPQKGVTWTNPLFTTTGSGVFLFWVDPASPALSTFGDYRLLTGAGKGIAAEKVVFDDAKVIGKARISGLFGTAESDPYGWSPISKFVGTPASVGARIDPPPGFQILVR